MSEQPNVVPNNTLKVVIIVVVVLLALSLCAAGCVILSSAGLMLWSATGS